VLRQLDTWFEHYNSVHPHKALGYRSPREFRKAVAEATENAVGAVRRPHEYTMSADVMGSRPKSPEAVARSASFRERSRGPILTTPCPVIQGQLHRLPRRVRGFLLGTADLAWYGSGSI